jgi:UDP-N-acetyl-D-glucosamine/UDP-N-acetyl-D-galactosamine dehydrogenase
VSSALTLRVAVVGLGYVGLPLAVALARHFPTIGFDINEARVAELKGGHDRTNEIDTPVLRASSLELTTALEAIRGCDVYIVTVPTPVDAHNVPDLSPVRSATKSVAKVLEAGRGQIIVYESTVYPGVTEDICGPLLEELTGLVCGKDFFLGYSPERINPGDREHTVDRITKVVAGQTPEVLETLAGLYGAVTTGGVFRAASIKVAEAAKVIENAQRDINIAFMNEIATIFQKIGISTYDVLDAAETKWNFLKFSPGLVGGHCIGVDPYYLSYRAQQLGHEPNVILAGRAINDGMGPYVAHEAHARLKGPSRVLVLGLTFKENIPDLRNSKVVDVISTLTSLGHHVAVHDPHADPAEAEHEYGLAIATRLADVTAEPYDAVVAAVPHSEYAAMTPAQIAALLTPSGLVLDIKGLWRHVTLPAGVTRWSL